ncbi:nSTAND1 domain-containing NTPase [Solirubrobacter soli]|uniref:nSTAND1 domain-containing NTPase n=1 Tax=Solirubrobacter soli TaxID=363832 RepID=UPI000420ACB6|nr:BTAD domain-containing putative transcriptional regulator [Solirubrobacter soli]
MEFLILGPLEVRDERGPVALGGSKPRAIVALLLLNANRAVSAERLALALWGEDAPARAIKTLQVHVSRLRKALGDPDTISTSPAGYTLRVRPGELDAERFDQLLEDGRRALKAGEADRAADLLRTALGLWRGPALADLRDEASLGTESERLEEHRLNALELRIEADLARGGESELIDGGELQRLVREHPTRESLVAPLMLALYRRGRQTEALEAFREARRRLVEAGGIEPGPELRALQAAILRQDRSLLGLGDAELPPELEGETGQPLEGRDIELAWLRERWEGVRAGAGALITLRGETGIGKSRLAAEFAAETYRRGATVLYADGAGPPAATLGVLARARAAPGPTVVVVDDAERAPDEVRDALETFGASVSGAPVLALVLEAGGGDGGEGLVLSPLDPGAVQAIVTRYVPDGDPPSEWLLGASRGVPGAIHELAGQWARREAARHAEERIETGARRTAEQRADLRSLERELADDLEVLSAARETPAAPSRVTGVCPFKGLASFQQADAQYFFGRERLVAELVARLVGAPLLAIVGPSGSGKSSVLRAGLLPALAAGVLPGSERCPVVVIRPGAHPSAELAAVPDGPVVLAVDQFEETFTVCEDEQERAAFVAELVRIAQASEGQGAVAIAMRDDFYGRCAEHPRLSRLVADNHVLVGAMGDDELRRAVECPAQRAGLIVEPDLVDALVTDLRGEPGALPLLSTALLELWQGLAGRRRLRHAAYVEAGGVRGAVARLGERAYGALDVAEQEIARRVLLRLAPIDDEGAVERRRIARADLGGEAVEEVVERLAANRLVALHGGTVELAHEALLREWPRLRGWIQESQDVRRVQRSLSTEARNWVRLDRDEGLLLRGALLAEVREYIDPDTLDVAVEREFLAASLERARRERRARTRRWEIIAGALLAGVIAIGIVAIIAIDQRRGAERERNLALSRALALQSAQTLPDDPEVALRLAMWADDTATTPQSTAALRQAVLGFRQRAVLRADPRTSQTAAFSPNGNWIVTGGDNGNAFVFNAATRARAAALPGRAAVLSARFSPDGTRIALGYGDGTVRVTGATLEAPHVVLRLDGPSIDRVAFSPDGKRLAAAAGDGTVHVVADGRTTDVSVADGIPIRGVDLDREGRIVTADDAGEVRLFAPDGTPIRTFRKGDGVPARDVDFSPDGKLVLVVGEDHLARLFDARTGASLGEVSAGPRKLTSGAFSPDGERFAAGSYDGTVRVWTTVGHSELFALRGQQSRVLDVGFGASGDRLVSAGNDGRVKVWDASGIRAFHLPSQASGVDFSPSGRWIATGSDVTGDGTVRVWTAADGTLARSFSGPAGWTPARFSPTSDELVIGRDPTASAERVMLPDGRPQRAVQLKEGSGINIARLDPTGRRLTVAAFATNEAVVQDVRSGRSWSLRGGPPEIVDLQASPDGKHAVAASREGELYVWDLSRPDRPVRTLRGHTGHINTLAYSDDGRVVTAGADRTARVWDPRTLHPPVVLRGHTDEVNAAQFTPDGKRVITASADGTVRLWDALGGDALVKLEEQPDVPLYDVTQGPGGSIATLDDHEIVRVFRCEVCGPLGQIRAAARALKPRALTAVERERYLTDVR